MNICIYSYLSWSAGFELILIKSVLGYERASGKLMSAVYSVVLNSGGKLKDIKLTLKLMLMIDIPVSIDMLIYYISLKTNFTYVFLVWAKKRVLCRFSLTYWLFGIIFGFLLLDSLFDWSKNIDVNFSATAYGRTHILIYELLDRLSE